jgi:hypothetical protein
MSVTVQLEGHRGPATTRQYPLASMVSRGYGSSPLEGFSRHAETGFLLPGRLAESRTCCGVEPRCLRAASTLGDRTRPNPVLGR